MSRKYDLAVMHVHSDWSHDGNDSLASIRAFAAREQLRYVFMTDHAEDFDSERFVAYVSACKANSSVEHQLVPGLEFRFDGFPGLHLLAIGLRAWISPSSPEEFCRLGSRHAGCLVMAHPVLTSYEAPEMIVQYLHGIEVWNAGYNTRFLPDGRAIAFWKKLRVRWPQLVATVGTDQHRIAKEGKVRIQLPTQTDPLEALRNGTFRNFGLTCSFSSSPQVGPIRLAVLGWLRSGLNMLRRMLGRL